MDNPIYAALSRQEGLERLMRITANNIANASTDGYRRESGLFAEWVNRLPVDGGGVSQSRAFVRSTDFSQGALQRTGATLDLAIEGEGFFRVLSAQGEFFTRAGSFTRSPAGEIVTSDGARLLDEGGAPMIAPGDAASLRVAADGTVSSDGAPLGRIGIVQPLDLSALTRSANGRFTADADTRPAENATIRQGFIEESNVDAIRELTRMIDIQRSYEAAQNFMRGEDERLREAVRVIGAR